MALVLVIHADLNIRNMVAEFLTLDGHEVVSAPDGREGLRIIREATRPAIVLLDLMMPVLDGRGVLQALQTEPALRAKHAVILWSPVMNLEEVGSAFSVDGTLSLPFTVDQLFDAIAHGEQVLESKAGQQP